MKGYAILLWIVLSFLMNKAESQPIYNVPWAINQPKFVFPVYLEESSGMRDTVYICYDPNAHVSPVNADTIFGQKFIPVDTNSFYAYFENSDFCGSFPQQCDSQIKASVSQIDTQSLYEHFPVSWYHIGFKNGNLPVKISWDISTLYSDSLPFPNTPVQPHAQGNFTPYPSSPYITLNGNGNSMAANYLTDLPISDTNYVFKDSCTISFFPGSGPFTVESCSFGLYFEKWGAVHTNSANIEKPDFNLYPNPANQFLNIDIIYGLPNSSIQICNLSGQEKIKYNINNSIPKFQIATSDLKNGCYILKYSGNNFSKVYKLIVIH